MFVNPLLYWLDFLVVITGLVYVIYIGRRLSKIWIRALSDGLNHYLRSVFSIDESRADMERARASLVGIHSDTMRLLGEVPYLRNLEHLGGRIITALDGIQINMDRQSSALLLRADSILNAAKEIEGSMIAVKLNTQPSEPNLLSAIVTHTYDSAQYLREIVRESCEPSEPTDLSRIASILASNEIFLKGLSDMCTVQVDAINGLTKELARFQKSIFAPPENGYSEGGEGAEVSHIRDEDDEIQQLIQHHGVTEKEARGRVRENRIYRTYANNNFGRQ